MLPKPVVVPLAVEESATQAPFPRQLMYKSCAVFQTQISDLLLYTTDIFSGNGRNKTEDRSDTLGTGRRGLFLLKEAAEVVGGDAGADYCGSDYEFVSVAEEFALIAHECGDH